MSIHSKITGMSSIKKMSSISKGPASKKTEKSEFLELYILGKEKSRLEQECLTIDNRKLDIQRRIAEINMQSESLMKSCKLKENEKNQIVTESGDKVWKKMKMSY